MIKIKFPALPFCIPKIDSQRIEYFVILQIRKNFKEVQALTQNYLPTRAKYEIREISLLSVNEKKARNWVF